MTRFRVARHPDLRIAHFDDESVVFNPFLWHTHLLNAAAALVLDALEETPATAAELAAVIVDEAGAPAVPEAEIDRLLGELERLALIEPVPGDAPQ